VYWVCNGGGGGGGAGGGGGGGGRPPPRRPQGKGRDVISQYMPLGVCAHRRGRRPRPTFHLRCLLRAPMHQQTHYNLEGCHPKVNMSLLMHGCAEEAPQVESGGVSMALGAIELAGA
jgi:hypothetical protein